ncbi:MAG: methionine--tRNA ligase subunit beta [Candidatus Omnitrophota bacterium]
MVTIDDFKKLEIKIAKILDVQDHPTADRLYIVRVSLGDKEKQLVAGIKNSYSKEELMSKLVIVVDNLEPAVIRGKASEGMLLAAKDSKGITVLTTDREVELGSPVS